MFLGPPPVRPFLLRRHHFGRRRLRHGQTHISRKNSKKTILFIVQSMSLLQAASSDNSSTSWVFRRIGTHVVMCFIGMTKVFLFFFLLFLKKKIGRHFCKKVILFIQRAVLHLKLPLLHTHYVHCKDWIIFKQLFCKTLSNMSKSKWSSILGGPHSTPDDLLLKYKDLVKKGDQWFTDQVFLTKKCFWISTSVLRILKILMTRLLLENDLCRPNKPEHPAWETAKYILLSRLNIYIIIVILKGWLSQTPPESKAPPAAAPFGRPTLGRTLRTASPLRPRREGWCSEVS